MVEYAYPKTDNLLARDPETNVLKLGEYREPGFDQVNKWHVTEKIDGTNIRIVLDLARSEDVTVRGRTEKATTVTPNFLEEAFGHISDLKARTYEALEAIQPGAVDEGWFMGMTIFGEGYGPGIQKGGGNYSPTKQFRIFDVVTFGRDNKVWRLWQDVETVAGILDLKTAPVLGDNMSTLEVQRLVRLGINSEVAYEENSGTLHEAEGVIARTSPYLYDWKGQRIMFKCKTDDMRKAATARDREVYMEALNG